MTAPRDKLHRHPSDAWTTCALGHRHWGTLGAAGLLLADYADGAPVRVVLQHRAPWSHGGDTWGIPGGAIAPGEEPLAAALREAEEEAGIEPRAVGVLAESTEDHGNWAYTTVLAAALVDIVPAVTDAESLEVAWVAVEEVERRPLFDAFGAAWPQLLRLLHAHAR